MNFFSIFCFNLSFATSSFELRIWIHKKQTDGRQNGHFYNLFSWFLEGTRLSVNTAQKTTTILFTAYSFGMHATKGSTTNFSISTPTHLIPPYQPFLFVFLHLSSFLSAIKNACFYRFGLKANFCTLFLVRTCLKLPSPGHALRIRSTAPILDWISTSFSHDRNLNA